MKYTVLTEQFLNPEKIQAWENLTQQSASANFFTEPDIQQAWWNSFGQPDLQVIEVIENDQLIGVVPLCTADGGKTLQFLGDEDLSDYLDIVIHPEHVEAVFEGFQQYLQNDTNWQTVKLVSIPQNSLSLHHLHQVAENNGWQFQQVQQDVCPIIDLPESWEEYLAAVGKKQRHEITRKWRRLEEAGSINFEVFTNINDRENLLEEFFTLHHESSIEKAKFWTVERREYFQRLTDAASKGGWLRLYFLYFNNQPAATMMCFDYKDSLLLYNSGFDAAKYSGMSIGNVLNSFTIKDAVQLGKKKFDFLRGNEEYKFRYGAKPYPVFNVLLQRANGL